MSEMLEKLQARGDRDLAKMLLDNRTIGKAIEQFEEEAEDIGARRQLLGTSLRLPREVAPDVHDIIEGARDQLELETPFEVYVYPSPNFNAAAVRPERGTLFIMVSAALLESFEPDELRFVLGHELGHHLFDHHRIPIAALLNEPSELSPATALRLFAWQRYAEISCDRAGVFCAGGLAPAAMALLKLASGLHGARVRLQVDAFLEQLEDYREETERLAKADEPARAEWFASHPFSPLRLRAAQLFNESELMVKGGTGIDALEDRVQQLMTLMDPSYLQEPSEVAEAMRRLLFAAGVAVATAGDKLRPEEIEALEELLGPGSIPPRLKPEAIVADLPRRIRAVRDRVPPLRRTQVIRDLCVIAKADGRVEPEELAVIRDVAKELDVDPELVGVGKLAE